MKLKCLNNTLSPSVLIKGDKNILVNTPKGFHKNLKENIDAIIFTSDDKYHICDLDKIKSNNNNNNIISCYILKKWNMQLKKKVKKLNCYLEKRYIVPFREIKTNILPISVKRKSFSIYSDDVLGYKINKTLLITSFSEFTNKSLKYIKDCEQIIITAKYLKENNREDYLSIEKIIKKFKDIKKIGLLGLSKKLKGKYKNYNLNVGEEIKV